jgi:hypothetical protein
VTLPLAHGIGGIRDLPVPEWLFYYGGAIVLVLSFTALGVLWRRPLLDRISEPAAGPRLQRILLSRWLRVALGAVGVALLVLVVVAALFGDRSVTRNFAPTFVWVVFWLGLVPVVVVFGNVWPALNPWRAVADALAWGSRRTGRQWRPPLSYPARLGRWPAAALLFAFVAFELAYVDPGDPRAIGYAVLVYSYLTWFGMLFFGRETWLRHGEAFTVYFTLLGRMAPLGLRRWPDPVTGDTRREVVVRPPVVGLAKLHAGPGIIAFIAVMLGSVGFDGFSRTAIWQDLRWEVLLSLRESPALADLAATGLNLLGLAAAVGVVALAYLLAVEGARRLTRTPRSLAGLFAASLVPIALAYAVAHYFSLLVIQGQFTVPLASDPLGHGWDVLGTAGVSPNLQPLSPNTIWYVQVGALVVGHVLGLALAHDRAVSLFPSARAAVRSQYPMLVLMVLYTVAGLWLLSEG